MNIGQIIAMLKVFPEDTAVLNAPISAHIHQGNKKGIAFKAGRTIFNQNETHSVSVVLGIFEFLLEPNTSQLYGMEINNKTEIFLTETTHGAGDSVKGVFFNPQGIRFMPEERF